MIKRNDLEKTLKALANRRRLAILKLLRDNKELTVGELAERINLSFKSTSRHLSVLSYSEIVQKEQRGLEMYFSLSQTQKLASKHILSIL
ncbi:MAG: metalloregulator ArsR/SmtB family transcription factor [Candidatus Taylorbacteria bacterium]